jgi:hypothetical protein
MARRLRGFPIPFGRVPLDTESPPNVMSRGTGARRSQKGKPTYMRLVWRASRAAHRPQMFTF